MNTIFTAAAGYQPDDLLPFLVSAERHLRHFEAVLLIGAADEPVLRPLTQRFPFVRFARLERGHAAARALCWLRYVALGRARAWQQADRQTLSPPRRRGIECGMNPALARYFLIERLLAQLPPDDDARVMLADSRDIVFQGDAFAALAHPLVTGAEPAVVGPRDRWIGLVYGPAGQARLAGRQVYCSGFTIGRRAAVEAYVRQICDEMWAHLPAMLFHRGLDQAIHIRLLHDGLLPAQITQNRDGYIATISLERPENLAIDEGARAVRVFGQIPAVLHQYDRHPHLAEFVHRLARG